MLGYQSHGGWRLTFSRFNGHSRLSLHTIVRHHPPSIPRVASFFELWGKGPGSVTAYMCLKEARPAKDSSQKPSTLGAGGQVTDDREAKWRSRDCTLHVTM